MNSIFFRLLVVILSGALSTPLLASPDAKTLPTDQLFDWGMITNTPLEAITLLSRDEDSLTIETIEYTYCYRNGKPIRISGILAYPKGGIRLPAVFWSQSGLQNADEYFPKLFARKGYFCLNINLLQDPSLHKSFDAKHPREANFTQLAVQQLRAITYLWQRPEVDKERIGIGGASYGGFFATLLAGADPRIKAGFSYFAGGNQELGTNLRQFDEMASLSDVTIWNTTIDPAWRLKRRSVPFLWCASANDHWFQLPSVVKTYEQSIGEKRLAIVPGWQQAFPENIDTELIDWLDIWLARTRKPYNMPSALQVLNEQGRLRAHWNWTGPNKVIKAELIVSYGATLPWHGWIQRHHEVLPASIQDSSAMADIPVPRSNMAIYCYGNITDDKQVVISTPPLTVIPASFGITANAADMKINCFPIGDFETNDISLIQRSSWACGTVDMAEKYHGEQSLFISPKMSLTFPLWHVPGRSHNLHLFLKAGAKEYVNITVKGVPPQNWNCPVVNDLRRSVEPTPQIYTNQMPVYSLIDSVDTQWREYSLTCPVKKIAVEGYTLTIAIHKNGTAPVWIDWVRFEPVWIP
jgi:dienelactone hydrolase